MIQLSQISQIPQIFEIFQDCKHAMEKEGIFQWTECYPSFDLVAGDVSKRHTYGIYQENKCLGVITINTDEEPEYESVNWEDKDGLVMVIHRLAISPLYQQQGFGKQLMDFAENYSLQNGYTSIRLDTYSNNPKAVSFYEKRGYNKRGEVYFTGRELPFFCFEKRL